MSAAKEVARRVCRREIPGFLELEWEARRKKNPLALAVKLDQNESARVMSLLGFAIVVSDISMTFFVDQPDHSLSFLFFFLFLIGVWMALWFFMKMRQTEPGDETEVEDFWNELRKLERIIDHSSREFVHKGDGEMARSIAGKRMKATASQLEAGAITTNECSARYDTLLLFGLVPPGGYGGYCQNRKKPRKTAKTA